MRSHAEFVITGMSVADVMSVFRKRRYAMESGKQLATIDAVMTYEVLHYPYSNANKRHIFVKHRNPFR